MKHRAIRMSVASGCLWGLIGLAVAVLGTRPSMNQPGMTLRNAATAFAGGLVTAPIIGLLIGLLSRPFRHLPVPLRIIVAGGSLYCAVLLFIVANGLTWAARLGRLPQDFWFNSVASAWASLVWTWFFVFLWPLAYVTHMLVSRAWDRDAFRTAG